MTETSSRVISTAAAGANSVATADSVGEVHVVGHIERGTPVFRQASLAIFFAGFATFSLLYCVQPIMPVFSAEFKISASESSLPLSLAISVFAFAMLAASALSEVWGRKRVMVMSVLASAFLTLLSAFSPSWDAFILLRALIGLTLSGLPAAAMAYMSEEMNPRATGFAVGLYVGGTALGGMTGRLLGGVLTDYGSWRFTMAVVGALSILAGVGLWHRLPASRHYRRQSSKPRHLFRFFMGHLRDPGLRWLYVEGFLVMGGFVTIYNYIGYLLIGPPYHLSQSALGAIFLTYLIGIGSSTWCGILAGRVGHRRILWIMVTAMLAGVAMTLFNKIQGVLLGLALLTFGLFGAQSVVSSWVGLRAQYARAQASSLYLCSYYLGSGVLGVCGGFFWSAAGWHGVVIFVISILVIALLVSLRLATLKLKPQELPALECNGGSVR